MSASAFDEAFEKVKQLAATFRANEKTYLDSSYTEARARKDFIDKFFMALGWDVNHDIQTNPSAQEVSVEPAEGTSKRRADYAFRIAPDFRKTRFFVEAKKPHGDIATADNYFQTIRYGWPNRTPLAVLTDFEQFHVLDSRYEPNIDTALERWVKRFKYTDYTERDKFAEIYWLFSREAVATGELEKFAATLPKGRGKKGLPTELKDIDDSFLEKLDGYRDTLAHAFKNRNPRLDSETLTEITQRTLDRLVFLRFLEDKLIEPRRLVAGFGTKNSAWQDFIAASRRLDGIYNGIVYKSHDLLDSSTFRVDDQAFAAICHSLSDTYSPYDFNSIPIHILGSIYERFLGKVVVATDKRVRVEEKPEVRKAGGVYYTPEYIVRYIVENTVGKLITGKTPDQVAEMHFADIACGSGSFLLGMYDLLLTHHGTYYNENPGKARQGDCIERDGKFYLSLRKKREILLNNIYGVDIDTQAVEVCQLSLYLKLLEDETTASAREHQLEFHETLLPPLNKNIVCGNSLIGTDILEGQLFAGEDERKLNPMNFEDAFPHIFGRQPATVRESESEYSVARSIGHEGGRRVYPSPPLETRGFDAIVGNPPYILLQILEQRYVFGYIAAKYRAAKYKIDTYQVFLERALALTKSGGRVGYITPNSFLRNKHARELRRLILEESNVELLRLFFYQVFSGASVDTSVIVLERAARPADQHRVAVLCSKSPEDKTETQWQPQRIWCEHPENHFSLPGVSGSEELEAKMRDRSLRLGEFATAYFGIQTFDREKFVKPRHAAKRFKPVIDGVHINRYALQRGGEFVDFCPSAIKSGGNPQVYEQPRIGVRQIGKTPIATFLPAGLYTLNTIYNIFFTKPTGYDLRFILGIVCSKALGWYWLRTFFDQKETFPKIKKDALLSIPIPRIDFSDTADKTRHDQMVRLVEAMLEAKKELAKAKTDKDKTYYENKCAALDRQIDALVYELYGLTADEIKIVEENK